jgi:hypothetical protein
MLQAIKNKLLDSRKIDPYVADVESACRPEPRGLTEPDFGPPFVAESPQYLPLYDMRTTAPQSSSRPLMSGHRSPVGSPRGSPRGSPNPSPPPSPRGGGSQISPPALPRGGGHQVSPPVSPRGRAVAPVEVDPDFAECKYCSPSR